MAWSAPSSPRRSTPAAEARRHVVHEERHAVARGRVHEPEHEMRDAALRHLPRCARSTMSGVPTSHRSASMPADARSSPEAKAAQRLHLACAARRLHGRAFCDGEQRGELASQRGQVGRDQDLRLVAAFQRRRCPVRRPCRPAAMPARSRSSSPSVVGVVFQPCACFAQSREHPGRGRRARAADAGAARAAACTPRSPRGNAGRATLCGPGALQRSPHDQESLFEPRDPSPRHPRPSRARRRHARPASCPPRETG